MCLALPARVVSLSDDGSEAVVDLGGVRKGVSVALVPEARVGDYVIVHVGHAIGLIDPEEAARTLALFGELAALEDNNSVRAEPVEALQPNSPAPLRQAQGEREEVKP